MDTEPSAEWERLYGEMVREAQVLAEQAVTRGEQWLDVHVPTWWHEGLIPLNDSLDMSDARSCMFGWLARTNLEAWFGALDQRRRQFDYTDALLYIGKHQLVEPEYKGYDPSDEGDGAEDRSGLHWAADHGFYIGPVERGKLVSYGLLREVWVQRISARRAAAHAPQS